MRKGIAVYEAARALMGLITPHYDEISKARPPSWLKALVVDCIKPGQAAHHSGSCTTAASLLRHYSRRMMTYFSCHAFHADAVLIYSGGVLRVMSPQDFLQMHYQGSSRCMDMFQNLPVSPESCILLIRCCR